MHIYCEPKWCTPSGRRTDGLAEPEVKDHGPGALFAQVAHLEAASVHAFLRLERELRHHGAPASLIRAARQAARQEAQHARVTRRLARRFGGVVPRVRLVTGEPRSLEAIAVENAVEGQVRERGGALLAHFQLRAAHHPEVRAAMARIAPMLAARPMQYVATGQLTNCMVS